MSRTASSLERKRLSIGATTYTWAYRNDLYDTLHEIVRHDVSHFELNTSPWHLEALHFGPYDRFALSHRLADLGITPVCVNPGYMDINLLSPHSDHRALSERMIEAEIDLAADVGAEFVSVIPGRRHELAPAPLDLCLEILDRSLPRLAKRAQAVGVTIVLETSPYGFMTRGMDLVELIERYGSPSLGINYDVANSFASEDPLAALRQIASALKLVHISDCTRAKWAHDPPGTGEIDLAGIARTLREIGYEGTTIYELVVPDPAPLSHYARDLKLLEGLGWDRSARYRRAGHD